MKRSGSVSDEFVVSHKDGRVVESAGCYRFTKLVRRCSSPPPSTSHLGLEEEEDGISKLPDHVLVLILSLMMTNALGKKGEIEQLVRTSVLARRWRFLWCHSLKSLVFTFSARDSRFGIEDDSVCEAAHRRFVDWVNLILGLPVVGDTIDDFNLTFWLSSCQTYWSDHLPRWIGFALQKRVKQLTITLEQLDIGYGLEDLKNSFTLDNKLISIGNMDSLLSLCLCRVDVTGDFLEHLLTICGSLQHLSISYSTTLVDFTVSGPSLKLKYLKIQYCLKLRRLRIRHVNLVSLDYNPVLDTNHAAVLIEDAPSLVNARLNCFKGKDKTAKVLTHLPHLHTLGLAFHGNWFLMGGHDLVFPKLTNLVKVELELKDEVFSSTICASLLVSCPSIRELLLKFLTLVDSGIAENKVERLEHPHECLKVVELVGYTGCKLDAGVALYLIENTLSLDKIVVDTSHPYRIVDTRTISEEVEDEASQFETKLSESEMLELADSIARSRAHMYEYDIRERARARAHAEEHLATRLSGTRTQIIVK